MSREKLGGKEMFGQTIDILKFSLPLSLHRSSLAHDSKSKCWFFVQRSSPSLSRFGEPNRRRLDIDQKKWSAE